MKKVIVLLGIILLGYAFNEFSPFEKKLITNFTASDPGSCNRKKCTCTRIKACTRWEISCGSELTKYCGCGVSYGL